MHKETVALYLRISDEDDIAGESNSIAGQRLLLGNYVESNAELSNYKILTFIDDGYSGTNFNRPGISKLLECARSGEIACIVVKDFSRLGRNYLEVGHLIEQVFPFLRVRFISVNDYFDSNLNHGAAGAVDIAFKNLIHDLYSKDLSQKVTSVRRSKAEQGKFVTAFAPYGYLKSKSEKNTLVIDEECAVIVRRIYQMSMNGISKTAIAKQLNAESIPSPIMVRKLRKDNYKSWCANEKCHWTTPTISHILNDCRYTGDLVYGKVKPSAVGSGIDIPAPKEEWIIVPDAHPAIISKEIFKVVQNMKRTHIHKGSYRSPLTGKIKCSVCNHAFINKSGRDAFFCRTHLFTNAYNCFSGKLSRKVVEKAVLDELNMFTELCEKAEQTQPSKTSEKETLLNKLSSLSRKVALLKKEKLVNYESYKEKKTSKDRFITKRHELENDISAADEEINHLESELDNIESPSSSTLGYGTFEVLTKELSDKFIKEIIVNENGHMQIHWNFPCSFNDICMENN